MSAATDWWRARSRREQVLLGVMTLLAVPILAWLLLIAPATGWHDRAKDNYVTASDRYGRVKALADTLEAPGTGGAPRIVEPLDQFVAASADQAGFSLTRNNASGPGRTEIGIAQARSAAALAWLDQLRRAGVRIEALSMTDNGEGGVALDLTLTKASS